VLALGRVGSLALGRVGSLALGAALASGAAVASGAALSGCGAPGSSETEPAAAAPAASAAAMACHEAAIPASEWKVVGGDMVVMPSCDKNRGARPPGWGLGVNGRHVLFVNFEGVDVRNGRNALENEGLRDPMFKNQDGVIAMDAFDPDGKNRNETILKIQKQVAKWYADMNVDVVISRPLSGDYLMTVVGGDKSDIGLGGGVVGISPGDCKNAVESDLNYAFSHSLSENPEQVAVTIAHEAGHAYGLGHVQNSKDIMFPSVSTVDGFLDQDMPAADPGPCGFMPGDTQNDRKVLIENLGKRTGAAPTNDDKDRPVVTVLQPKDGDMVGKDVEIAVKATAARGVDHVTLSLSKIEQDPLRRKTVVRGNHPIAELRPPQSVARVRLSAAGSYQLTATAYDLLGNVNLTQISFVASAPACRVANDCTPGQRCENSLCVTPPLPTPTPAGMGDTTRAYGETCEHSSDCKGGLCAITPVGQICTHYCNSERLCAGNLECVDGICMPAMYPRATPKIGQLGGRCTRNQDCFSGECSPATDPGKPRYCTKLCDPAVAWACPATMDCIMTDGAGGMKNRCIAKPEGAGGADGTTPVAGCSTAGPAHSSRAATGGASALLLVFGLIWLGRRRRIDPRV
jgi:hypothetical protein